MRYSFLWIILILCPKLFAEGRYIKEKDDKKYGTPSRPSKFGVLSAPTRSPTLKPSLSPTSPTLTPSLSPTLTPSLNPTLNPSVSPTSTAILSPTLAPSLSPTLTPSQSPTLTPSLSPTLTPSLSPTLKPSLSPSLSPTLAPTTLTPSRVPTLAPTSLPTRSPTTSEPTVSPTLAPTYLPGAPTPKPTKSPTATPTKRPTAIPTAKPTRKPTLQPTSHPSSKPTSFPTSVPTSRPTAVPTSYPTSQPTGQPTDQPSRQPSNRPSQQPTDQPTTQPTSQPSRQPSRNPSSRPSSHPSSHPTCAPVSTPRPSVSPTATPTPLPTLSPTPIPGTPTESPTRTRVPTYYPTAIPTVKPTSSPTGAAVSSFGVSQIVSGMSLAQWLSDSASVSNVFKLSVGNSIGVPESDVNITAVSSESTYSVSSSTSRSLETSAVAINRDVENKNIHIFSLVSSSSSVLVNYTVYFSYTSLGFSSASSAYSTLETSLVEKVSSGNFTTVLRHYASSLSCAALSNASSSSLSVHRLVTGFWPTAAPTSPPTAGPSSAGAVIITTSEASKFSGGAIAGVTIGGAFVALCIVLAVLYCCGVELKGCCSGYKKDFLSSLCSWRKKKGDGDDASANGAGAGAGSKFAPLGSVGAISGSRFFGGAQEYDLDRIENGDGARAVRTDDGNRREVGDDDDDEEQRDGGGDSEDKNYVKRKGVHVPVLALHKITGVDQRSPGEEYDVSAGGIIVEDGEDDDVEERENSLSHSHIGGDEDLSTNGSDSVSGKEGRYHVDLDTLRSAAANLSANSLRVVTNQTTAPGRAGYFASPVSPPAHSAIGASANAIYEESSPGEYQEGGGESGGGEAADPELVKMLALAEISFLTTGKKKSSLLAASSSPVQRRAAADMLDDVSITATPGAPLVTAKRSTVEETPGTDSNYDDSSRLEQSYEGGRSADESVIGFQQNLNSPADVSMSTAYGEVTPDETRKKWSIMNPYFGKISRPASAVKGSNSASAASAPSKHASAASAAAAPRSDRDDLGNLNTSALHLSPIDENHGEGGDLEDGGDYDYRVGSNISSYENSPYVDRRAGAAADSPVSPAGGDGNSSEKSAAVARSVDGREVGGRRGSRKGFNAAAAADEAEVSATDSAGVDADGVAVVKGKAKFIPIESEGGRTPRTVLDECKEVQHISSDFAPYFFNFIARVPPKSDFYPDLHADNISIQKPICDGSNSNIFEATMYDMPVVLKRIKPSEIQNESAVNEFVQEREMLSRMTHGNIICMYGAGSGGTGGGAGADLEDDADRSSEGNLPFLLLEPLQESNLKTIIHRKRAFFSTPFTYRQFLGFAAQLADAINYLHNDFHPGCIVIHRDIKPENIGFTADGTLKLMDFGTSICIKRPIGEVSPGNKRDKKKQMLPTYTMTGETGSLRYMAPEVALSTPYNERVDIYSFGLVLYEMLTGVSPYGGISTEEFYARVIEGGERPPTDVDDYGRRIRADTQVLQLVERCWSANPQMRPDASDIVMMVNTVQDVKRKGSDGKAGDCVIG